MKAKPCLKCQYGQCNQTIDKKGAADKSEKKNNSTFFVKGASASIRRNTVIVIIEQKEKKILNSNLNWFVEKKSCPGRRPCQKPNQMLTQRLILKVDSCKLIKTWFWRFDRPPQVVLRLPMNKVSSNPGHFCGLTYSFGLTYSSIVGWLIFYVN